jgi:hypothetical protein
VQILTTPNAAGVSIRAKMAICPNCRIVVNTVAVVDHIPPLMALPLLLIGVWCPFRKRWLGVVDAKSRYVYSYYWWSKHCQRTVSVFKSAGKHAGVC